MQSYKVRGIILKRINLGEADRIITAYTEEAGKIKFVAKGIRKVKSKYAGFLELFYDVDLILAQGKNLDILTSVNINNVPNKKEPDIETIKLESLIAEVVDKTIPENSPNLEIFELLEEVYSQIDGGDLALLRLYFESKFFQISGLAPELSVCVKCGQKPDKEVYFSANAGGILDSKCSRIAGDAAKISQDVAKAWRFAITNNYNRFSRLRIDEETLATLQRISKKYLKHITQREYKSDNL